MPLTLRLQRLRVGTIARTKNVDSVVKQEAYLTFGDFVDPAMAGETIASKNTEACRRRVKEKILLIIATNIGAEELPKYRHTSSAMILKACGKLRVTYKYRRALLNELPC